MEGDVRIPSGCAISGIINRKRRSFSGTKIIDSIAVMHDRSNGLGGGFAAYGIYPEYKNHYAFHMFFDSLQAKEEVERFFNSHFAVDLSGRIPTRKVCGIGRGPILWRYFMTPLEDKLRDAELSADEYVAQCVMKINSCYKGAFVASSGKNMGAFKAVGFPEDVGEYYRLDEYSGYIWTAHGRFPTNTPGWWGGAHPFTLLDWSVVHNGEISSYDANRRYLEMFDYQCTLQTDTEAITYTFDLLLRKHGLPLDLAVKTVAAPFWESIDRMDEQEKRVVKALRTTYSSLLINGPFSIILGSKNGFMALNDRLKLRSLVAAEDKEELYVASEEAAIRAVCANPEKVWSPQGGEPIIGLLEGVESL